MSRISRLIEAINCLVGIFSMATLLGICSEFSSDDRCRELLARLRWPDGVECLRCSESGIARLSPKLWYCRKCDYQFSVTVGTVFTDSKLPLLTWFAAVYLLCESRKGMSANQLKRMLGVSYKTAWYLGRRIRVAMRENEMSFRFNRRHNSDLFVDTLRCMVNTDPSRFADLVK